jgi:hypothetical protein
VAFIIWAASFLRDDEFGFLFLCILVELSFEPVFCSSSSSSSSLGQTGDRQKRRHKSVCVETEPADMAFSVGSLPPSSRRDRTSEFHAIADRLRKSTPLSSSANGSTVNGSSSATTSNGHHHHEQPSRVHGPEFVGSTQSEFNKRASRIGLSIHQTSQKLSKLTKCKVTAEGETLD